MIDTTPDPARCVRGVPADIAARIRAMGRILGPELVETTQAMDASLHQRLPRPTMQVRPDIAYGSDARQRLDAGVFVRHGRPDGGAGYSRFRAGRG